MGKIEAKEKTQKALDRAQNSLTREKETNLALKADFDIEKGKISERERLAEEKARIEAEFPRYEALDTIEKQIKNDEDAISKKERQLKKDRDQYAADEAAFKTLKKEFESLEDAGEGKEKLSRQKEKAQQKQEKLKNLSKLFEGLHGFADTLDALQSDYKKASAASEKATADYEAKNRAFLDEQAGIIAETLENGKPCPVCGSLEHPCIAHKSAKAPTEAQLKRAKENADQARKTAEGLSGECKKAKGLLDAKKDETEKRAKELWQSVPFEDVENKLPEEQKAVSEEISALDRALSEEEKKVSRRSELAESLPKTEKALEEREKDILGRNTSLEADKASLSEKKKQRDTEKELLRFGSIEEAKKKSKALEKHIGEMKEAFDNAQNALSESDKKIAGYTSSIKELTKQISSDCDLDQEGETKKKTDITEKKAADDAAVKVLHMRIESNSQVLAHIREKVGELDALEKRYAWLKALSNTANGNISGKEKVMLETYIQMTYFDRIIARANSRFMVMSGGQYELKRRKEAENNRSQSGLDLDVIDHYNGTERSVKTLSGGESFKASLSLALGLSDEIQASAGGVRLDTMFVDEGFGSLDEESLDQAMRALSSLADGNRLVGIISHVADLKNRIDKQIVVTKEKSGGSKAQIIS